MGGLLAVSDSQMCEEKAPWEDEMKIVVQPERPWSPAAD